MKGNWFGNIVAMIITVALTASAFFGSLGLLIMAFKFFVRMAEGL